MNKFLKKSNQIVKNTKFIHGKFIKRYLLLSNKILQNIEFFISCRKDGKNPIKEQEILVKINEAMQKIRELYYECLISDNYLHTQNLLQFNEYFDEWIRTSYDIDNSDIVILKKEYRSKVKELKDSLNLFNDEMNSMFWKNIEFIQRLYKN